MCLVCVCVHRIQLWAKVMWLESQEKAGEVTDGDGVMVGKDCVSLG